MEISGQSLAPAMMPVGREYVTPIEQDAESDTEPVQTLAKRRIMVLPGIELWPSCHNVVTVQTGISLCK
jgi:hypothetical protein